MSIGQLSIDATSQQGSDPPAVLWSRFHETNRCIPPKRSHATNKERTAPIFLDGRGLVSVSPMRANSPAWTLVANSATVGLTLSWDVTERPADGREAGRSESWRGNPGQVGSKPHSKRLANTEKETTTTLSWPAIQLPTIVCSKEEERRSHPQADAG